MTKERQDPHPTFAIVLVCFLLSGIAALLYQTVWMRYFSILFGTSGLAAVTVLMAYMAGLALGAALIGKFIDRLQRPVFVYALLELGIAVSAALIPSALDLVQSIRHSLLGGLAELPSSRSVSQGIFYLATGFVIVMIPTAFMGATLPLLAKGVIHTRDDIGKRIGLLYSVNTFGAILGTLCAAFLLIPAVGLRLTASFGIALNILAGLLGLAAARKIPVISSDQTATEAIPGSKSPPRRVPGWRKKKEDPGPARPSHLLTKNPWPRSARVVLPLMFVSGALSFSYEILWTRLLGIVVGGSMTAFSTMLAGFLLGITLGSAIASRLARSQELSIRGLALAQLGTALLSIAAYHLLSFAPEWTDRVRLSGWPSIYWTALCSILLLLPSTICIGATFPFAVRILSTDPGDAAPAAARVYSWNTVGAILGAFLAGFFLIPAIGFVGMISAATTGNLLLALAAFALLKKTSRPVLIAGTLAILGAGFVFQPGVPTEILRSSRFKSLHQTQKNSRILFYDVGRAATAVAIKNFGSYYLQTNGLPEARIPLAGSLIYPRSGTQFMGILPCLANLSAESMLVVGLGGGQVINAVPSRIKSIDVVELEAAVVEANRQMAPNRLRDPLADPRVHLVINDARGALGLTEKTFDIIISQPSHPWTAGASHLYTLEFLQEAAAHLNPRGVFLQWVGTAFIDEKLARSLLATVSSIFPYVRVHAIEENLLILGSREPMDSLRDLAAKADQNGSILPITGWPALRCAEDAAATLLLDEEGVPEFCAGAPLSTDDQNLMAIRSPGLVNNASLSIASKRYSPWRDHDAFLQNNLLADLATIPAWSNPHLLWRISVLGEEERCRAVLGNLEGTEAALSRGLIALTVEDFATCLDEFGAVLATAPDNHTALFYSAYALMRTMSIDAGRRELFGDPAPANDLSESNKQFRSLASSLTADERFLLDTIYCGATAQWQKVRDADERLEQIITPRNLLFGLVSTQRARALLEGAPENWTAKQRRDGARKALGHVNRALNNVYYNDSLIELRGIAAAAAGHDAEFVDTIWHCLRQALSASNKDAPKYQRNVKIAGRLMKRHVPTDPAKRSPRIQELVDELAGSGLLTAAP